MTYRKFEITKQGQIVSCLVENVIAFKRKLKLFVTQLQNKELSKFPYLRQQSECVENNVNFMEYTKKIMLLQESFDGRFSDFSEEDRILAFLNPFSLTRHDILKMPSQIQMERCDLQANSVIKMKFNELPAFPSATETINFWRSMPLNIFQNSGNLPKVMPAFSEQHTGLSSRFHP